MKRSSLLSSMAVAMMWAAPALAEPQPSLPAPGQDDPAPAKDDPTVILANPDASAPQTSVQTSSSVSTSQAAAHDAAVKEGPPRYDVIRFNLGFRVGYVPSRAFDTFASSDVLSQSSIDGTYPLLARGKAVLAAGVGWDFGSRSDSLRGLNASLATHRLYVPIEGRYNIGPGVAIFAKVAPGAVAVLTSVSDASAPQELSGTGWAFSTDASAGGSIMLGSHQHMDVRQPRFWLTPEIGYALTTRAPVRTNPGRGDKDLLGSDEDTNLRSLALSGFFWRASVGFTY